MPRIFYCALCKGHFTLPYHLKMHGITRFDGKEL